MDQCTHCTCRGDLEKCESVDCNHHELWYVIALKDKMALKPSHNNDYATLAQSWRKLASESSDARYSARLYGYAEDLCQLNSSKATNCA